MTQPKPQRFHVRCSDVSGYQPANHTGTLNRRLIGPGTTGSSGIELIHGTLQPGQGALPHEHDGIEQACYLLSGRVAVTVGDDAFEMRPDECCYFPANVGHSVTAIGDEAAELLVVYSPPLAEGA